MRPATAVGASLEGERLARPCPWRVTVPYGEVELCCDWPASPTSLRGAVVEAIGQDRAHVDLHGHLEDGTTRQERATVLYRVHGRRPAVWAYGPRAHAHLAAIARLRHLRLPAGDIRVADEARMRLAEIECGVHKTHWYRYQVVDYYPTSVALARRPRVASCRPAWAGQALASSIRLWLEGLGLEIAPHRPVHVQVEDGQTRRLAWRERERVLGFTARFWTTAILPPGLGLGHHASEGFGEVRPCP